MELVAEHTTVGCAPVRGRWNGADTGNAGAALACTCVRHGLFPCHAMGADLGNEAAGDGAPSRHAEEVHMLEGEELTGTACIPFLRCASCEVDIAKRTSSMELKAFPW